ncbi:MAG: LL-diaminopimelate aminotransferase [Deltaproteobacteria bacterium RIFCSPLOWO2_02_FULL_50_16]|nr:MAG: LL-diaminopimelate aminotransferase [Deltaproteobacteria bacterium RIFCSPLOWO2_02_FULL_50_16]
MKIELADRIKHLPPYLFAEIDRLKQEQIRRGVDTIDLGVGDPDQPTPDHIIKALCEAVKNPRHHRYPSYVGLLGFREAAAQWMKRRYNVSINPATEVVSLIGSKEGIANLPYAFINPGDVVLIPSPGYPPYTSGTLFTGGKPYCLPLKRENSFLPDLKAIPKDILKRAKLIHVNYPNNPTSKVAPRSFYEEVVRFGHKNNIIVSSDIAYGEIYYGPERPLSLLEIDGAKDVAIEFHSLSKTFNMTGWRIGFAVGQADIIAGLGKIKTNIDSGIFESVQMAGIAALQKPAWTDLMRKVYQERHTCLTTGLKKIGFDIACAEASFYVWMAVPRGLTSATFAMKLLKEKGIIVTPGNGFGEYGEGYVRFALTQEVKRLEEALSRLKGIL